MKFNQLSHTSQGTFSLDEIPIAAASEYEHRLPLVATNEEQVIIFIVRLFCDSNDSEHANIFLKCESLLCDTLLP